MKKLFERISLLIRGIRMFRDWPLWILSRLGWLHRDGRGEFRFRNGISFALDFSRHNVGVFQEVWLMDLYEKRYAIKSGDAVIDIGASFGPFAVLAAMKGAIVYAYEPTPRSYSYLLENAKEKCKKIYNLAIAEKKGKIEMFESRNGDEGNSPLFSEQMKAEPFEADCIRLEDVIKETGRCDLLKIDCEGYELPILKSTPLSIFNFIMNIALEYHGNAPELIDILKKAGYSVERTGSINGYIYAWK